jgi:hypothetical protein
LGPDRATHNAGKANALKGNGDELAYKAGFVEDSFYCIKGNGLETYFSVVSNRANSCCTANDLTVVTDANSFTIAYNSTEKVTSERSERKASVRVLSVRSDLTLPLSKTSCHDASSTA